MITGQKGTEDLGGPIRIAEFLAILEQRNTSTLCGL